MEGVYKKELACIDKPVFLCYLNTIPRWGIKERRIYK